MGLTYYSEYKMNELLQLNVIKGNITFPPSIHIMNELLQLNKYPEVSENIWLLKNRSRSIAKNSIYLMTPLFFLHGSTSNLRDKSLFQRGLLCCYIF